MLTYCAGVAKITAKFFATLNTGRPVPTDNVSSKTYFLKIKMELRAETEAAKYVCAFLKLVLNIGNYYCHG